jgi:hypothetical protein
MHRLVYHIYFCTFVEFVDWSTAALPSSLYPVKRSEQLLGCALVLSAILYALNKLLRASSNTVKL